MTTRYCEAPSAPFPTESCCGHTSRMCPTATWPACNNCGEVPTIKSENPAMAESICLKPLNHRGKHSWDVAR